MNKSKILLWLLSFWVIWIWATNAIYYNNAWIDSELYNAHQKLYSIGITKLPLSETNFYSNSVRWEAALLTKRFAIDILNKEKNVSPINCYFSDSSLTSETISSEIQESCEYWLFKGNQNLFYPNMIFNRWHWIMVFARMLSWNPTMELFDSYDYLLQNKIIFVDDRYTWSEKPMNRDQLYRIMYRILQDNIWEEVIISLLNNNTVGNTVKIWTKEFKVQEISIDNKNLWTKLNWIQTTLKWDSKTIDSIYLIDSTWKVITNKKNFLTSNNVYLELLAEEKLLDIWSNKFFILTDLNSDTSNLNKTFQVDFNLDITAEWVNIIWDKDYAWKEFLISQNAIIENWTVDLSFKDIPLLTNNRIPLWSQNIYTQEIVINNKVDNKQVIFDWINVVLKWLVWAGAVEKVYIVDTNNNIISLKKSFTSSGETYINIKDIYEYNILKKGENKFFLVMDISNDSKYAAQRFSLSIDANVIWVDSTNVKWDVIVDTETYEIVNYQVQTVEVEWYITPSTKVYVWDENKLIWSFRVNVWNSTNPSQRDIILNWINVTNEWWRINEYINNVILKDGDWNTINTSVKLDKDKIYFNFTNWIELKDWQTMLFNVYANIVWGDNWDIIKLYLKDTRDLVWYEDWLEIPFNVSIDSTYKYFKEFVIQAGKLLISKPSTSPIATPLSPSISDKEVLRFKISSPSEINVDSLQVFANIKNNSAENVTLNNTLSKLKLYTCNETYTTCTFKSDFNFSDITINAWTNSNVTMESYLDKISLWSNYYSLRIDTSRYAKENVSMKFDINVSSFENPENNTWENISLEDIAWSVSSNYWTIWNNKINIIYNNNAILDFVKWKDDINGWKVIVSSNSLETLKLNNLRIKFQGDAGIDFSQIVNVRLMYNWNAIATSNSNSSGYIFFDSLSVNIPQNEQVDLWIMFDTTNSLYSWDEIKQITWKLEDNTSNNIIITTYNWSVINNSEISWTILSDAIKFYPTGKLYIYKDTNIPNSNILYNQNNYEKVYTFKLKSLYDDISIKDLYIVAYNQDTYQKEIDNTFLTWNTERFIDKIKYTWWTMTKEFSIVNWLSKIENLNDVIYANEEKVIQVYLKPWVINKIEDNNKNVKLALVQKVTDNTSWNIYTTKFVSMSNWEVLWNSYVISDDNMIWNKMYLRRWMVRVDTNNTNVDKILTNWAEHTIYSFDVFNLWSNKAKIKQFTLPLNLYNSWNNLVLKNFKIEFSKNNWVTWESWTNIKNNISWNNGTNINGWWSVTNADNTNMEVTTWTSLATNLYIKFDNNFENWYDILAGEKISFRVKAIVDWVDTSDSIRIDMPEYDNNTHNLLMGTYNTIFDNWEWARNTIIWTDNADTDWQTILTDSNWFEDYKVWGTLNSNTLTK